MLYLTNNKSKLSCSALIFPLCEEAKCNQMSFLIWLLASNDSAWWIAYIWHIIVVVYFQIRIRVRQWTVRSSRGTRQPNLEIRDASGLVLDGFTYLCPSYHKPLIKVAGEQVQNPEWLVLIYMCLYDILHICMCEQFLFLPKIVKNCCPINN